MGPQRWMAGAEVFQLIDALAALTGNIGVPGGGVNYASRLPALIDLSWMADRSGKSPAPGAATEHRARPAGDP